MVSNIIIDAVVGVVPLFGDLFDTAWKANTRNMDLLEAHLHRPTSSHSANRRFVALLWLGIIAIAMMLIGFCVLSVKLLLAIVNS